MGMWVNWGLVVASIAFIFGDLVLEVYETANLAVLGLFLLVPLLCPPQIATRQNHSSAHPGDRIYLDVVVSSTSGPPVSSPQ